MSGPARTLTLLVVALIAWMACAAGASGCGGAKSGAQPPPAASAQAAASASVVVSVEPAPRPPCEVAAEQRARVPGLLAEGRLDRTVRVIERADALCPKSAPETWAALVATLTELGRGEDVRRVADAIDASAEADPAARAAAKLGRETIAARERQTFDDKAKEAMRKVYLAAAAARVDKKHAEAQKGFLDAWSLYQPNGQALWSAGLVAKEMGDKVGAQRLFDRAIVELERVDRKKVVLDTPNGFSTRPLALAWNRDGHLLAVATGSVVSIRDRLLGWRETVRLEGQLEMVSVAFSPDGKILASGSRDETVRLWSVATGAELQRHQGHTVAFSPGGETIAVGAADGVVHLWSVETGVEARRLEGHTDEVSSVSFSPDGRTLASGSYDETVRLWNVATGAEKRKLPGHRARVGFVAFTPDGASVVASASGDRTVRLWNVTSGALVSVLNVEALSVAISPDGKTLFTGALDLLQWSIATGTQTRWPPSFLTTSIAISPDGKTLAWGDMDSIVRLGDVAKRAVTRKLRVHTNAVVSVAFSFDSKIVAAGCSRRGGSEDLTFSREGGIVNAGDPVRLWNLATAETRTLAGHEYGADSVVFSPDGRTLASSSSNDRTARLWNVATGTETRRLQELGPFVFSPDGKAMAGSSGASSGGVLVRPLATGAKVRKFVGDSAVAFSPEGTALVTGSSDGIVRLWNLATGTETRRFAGYTPTALSPDGATLASNEDKNAVRLWSVATGAALHELEGHTDTISTLAFSPDSKSLASGSYDMTVRLWDVATGGKTRKLAGHTQKVFSVAFAPNGKLLASGSVDGTLRFWSAAGDALLVLRVVEAHDASYVFTVGGQPLIELLGPEAEAAAAYPVCRVGALTFPFDLCRERFEVHGLFAKVLAGDPSYADP